MPFKDPEKRKEYCREYRKKNKEFCRKSNKEWRDKNKEYIYEQNKKYVNGEGKHINRCSKWRSLGIKLRPEEDWDSIYLFYITCENCEECGIELTEDKINTATTKTLDHDHDSGYVRDVLCLSCNTKRGFVDVWVNI